jgi:hypothetical protein
MPSEKRKRMLSTMIVTVGLPVTIVVLYFTTYNALGKRRGGGDNEAICYECQWQVDIFKPAAFVDSLALRKLMTTTKTVLYLN